MPRREPRFKGCRLTLCSCSVCGYKVDDWCNLPGRETVGQHFPETTEGVKEEEAEQSETTDFSRQRRTMLRFRAPFLFVASAGTAEAQGVEQSR